MTSPKEMAKDLSKQLVSAMIKRDITGWPPGCTVLTYQPVRPSCKENILTDNESDEK